VANDSNTDRVEYVAFLPDFGRKAGMVVGLMDSIADYERLAGFAKSAGLYFSATDFSYYANFRSDNFIDTLNDWGWYGVAEAPLWYTGEPWTTPTDT